MYRDNEQRTIGRFLMGAALAGIVLVALGVSNWVASYEDDVFTGVSFLGAFALLGGVWMAERALRRLPTGVPGRKVRPILVIQLVMLIFIVALVGAFLSATVEAVSVAVAFAFVTALVVITSNQRGN